MASKAPRYREPKFHRLEAIKRFTNDFEKLLGKGTFGEVYKGRDDEGNDIAVKVLTDRKGYSKTDIIAPSKELEFQREFHSLFTLSHKNIIQLVGYCYEAGERYDYSMMKSEQIIRLMFCFEYAAGGSLREYMSDHGDKLDWGTCYKIIKGTCEGLSYLHNQPSRPICHMDLKPDNILLDHEMTPKIADFGLAKILKDKNTVVTRSTASTPQYAPPEYLNGQVSPMYDIYSLGVIILEIIAGTKTYAVTDFFDQEDADEVFKKWRPKLSPVYYKQVKTCLQIALKCLERNRHNRPQIERIIEDMNKVENEANKVSVSLMAKDNSGIPEVTKNYATWERQTGRVVKQDKDIRSQTEKPSSSSSSSSHTRRSGDNVILYVTTLGGIRKTLDECNTIREALRSHRVDFIEKDLFDGPDHLKELKKLLAGTSYRLPVPVLSINGIAVADARKLLELHSDGGLQALFG